MRKIKKIQKSFRLTEETVKTLHELVEIVQENTDYFTVTEGHIVSAAIDYFKEKAYPDTKEKEEDID